MNKNSSNNQLSFISPIYEATISEIKAKIRLSMNGVAVGKMNESGLKYKKNYGVSTVRLKELARNYTPNEELAKQLWRLKIRETMIMSTLLFPIDRLDQSQALEWVEMVDNIEIAEQMTMNILSKLEYAPTLASVCIDKNESWSQIIGFMLAARTTHLMNNDDIQHIITRGTLLNTTDDYQLYKNIGIALARLCRIDQNTSVKVRTAVSDYHNSSQTAKSFIYNEVAQEILFLGY